MNTIDALAARLDSLYHATAEDDVGKAASAIRSLQGELSLLQDMYDALQEFGNEPPDASQVRSLLEAKPVAWRYRLHKTDGWTMTERELSPKELGPNGSQEPLYFHPPAVEGWQTMPKEPTEDMVDALADGIGIELVEEREEYHPSFTREDIREGIKAMLAALRARKDK